MTAQEIFDKVAHHLLTQNAKSQICEGQCVYHHSSSGRKCAVGCLIPDDKYCTNMEGIAVESLLSKHSELIDLQRHVTLLKIVQRIHDVGEVISWRQRLIECAANFGFTWTEPTV